MSVRVEYHPQAGKMYAQAYALYDNLPQEQRLFYDSQGDDCANFASQCVWAAYGGWLPGFSQSAVAANTRRIREDYRQTRGVWYGSKRGPGSNRWCRVEEFYAYVTGTGREKGPRAEVIAQGGWDDVDPAALRVGDLVQMVVTSYAPERFGHSLYVTGGGPGWDDVRICCHTEDRLDEPMGWFAQFPQIYSRMRVLRFGPAVFEI
jgi:hypothetical protein